MHMVVSTGEEGEEGRGYVLRSAAVWLIADSSNVETKTTKTTKKSKLHGAHRRRMACTDARPHSTGEEDGDGDPYVTGRLRLGDVLIWFQHARRKAARRQQIVCGIAVSIVLLGILRLQHCRCLHLLVAVSPRRPQYQARSQPEGKEGEEGHGEAAERSRRR